MFIFSSFSDAFSEQLSNSMHGHFKEIASIWLKMGLPTNNRDEKIDLLRSTILNQVKQFEDDERQSYQKMQNYQEYQLNEINKILTALTLAPYNLDTSKTLLTQNKVLSQKHKELMFIKTERLEHLERLQSKFRKACHLLGIEYNQPIFNTSIPSESELVTFRSKLSNQEQVLDSRKKRFESLKALVTKYQRELEYSPRNVNEEILLGPSNENVIYSQENLSLLTDLHKRIIQQFSDVNGEIETLKTRLTKLFERLEIEEHVCQSFWRSLKGTIPRIQKLLLAEIEKYEILKKSCMETIIKNIRKDIDDLWKKCMVAVFNDSLLNSVEFTEELLIEHEAEFSRLSKYHEHYSHVFEKLREWEDSLEQLLQLEKKLLDPNRFNNRGGALLQNERDRKMLTKKLPKLEKEVKSLVTMTESKEHIPFNMYGLNIEEYFESNWKHFHGSKVDAKKSVVIKRPGGDSSKKLATLSGQKNPRYPLSPRVNNHLAKKTPNPLASRRLFATDKQPEFLPREDEFRVCFQFT